MEIPATTSAPTGPLTPALYPTRVTHLHRSPIRHYAEHRSYSWFVDIDELPRLPRWLRPFARFEAVDHLEGAPGDTLRSRVDTFLARNGVFVPGGRVTALLMPRVLGRAFNPLTLFWCHDTAGVLRHVIAEVQTTGGARHAYLLPPGGDAPATEVAARAPFGGPGGHFLVRASRPGETLDLAVSVHRDSQLALVATWRGRRRRATAGRILMLQLTTPLAPQMAELNIRFQAAMLRLRGASPRLQPTRAGQTAGATPVHPVWAPNGCSWVPS